jgi:hypothetical protein
MISSSQHLLYNISSRMNQILSPAHWCRSNTIDLYSRGAWFESPPRQSLFLRLWWFSSIPSGEYMEKSLEELIVYFPLIRHKPHRKLRVQPFLYCCVFVASVTFSPSRCLAKIGDTYTDTETDGKHLRSTPLRLRWHDIHSQFRKYYLRHLKVEWGGGSQTQRMEIA